MPVSALTATRLTRRALGEPAQEAIGLLVLQGLPVRRVGVDGRFGAELLGQGDILRSW